MCYSYFGFWIGKYSLFKYLKNNNPLKAEQGGMKLRPELKVGFDVSASWLLFIGHQKLHGFGHYACFMRGENQIIFKYQSFFLARFWIAASTDDR